MFKLAIAAVACLAFTRVAAADPDDPTATTTYRDPATALALSAGSTAAAWMVVAVGASSHETAPIVGGAIATLFAPSIGQWYAGKSLTVGLGIRAASAALLFAAEIKAANCDSDDGGSCTSVAPMLVGGLIGYGAGTILDIVLAPRAARDFNRSHAKVYLAPTVIAAPSGPVMGLGIGGAL
jgi:hypothetical protein